MLESNNIAFPEGLVEKKVTRVTRSKKKEEVILFESKGPSEKKKERNPKYKDFLLRTNATLGTIRLHSLFYLIFILVLVVCPQHLVRQWHEEIEKLTKVSTLDVIELSLFNDFKGCTYGSIESAGIVILYSYFIN